MTALAVSILISLIMAGGLSWYAKRRSVDDPMTWGEAMLFSVYVFFLFFVVFGIVPHQWLTLAENEWSFRADRLFDGWGLLQARGRGGWFPFDITYRVLSDSVAAIIYIVYLVGMTKMWGQWQSRGQAKPSADVVTSAYGRPLVKRG